MSIFGEIGLDSEEIADVNAPLPDGQYIGNLFNVKVLPDKKNVPFRQIMFIYKVNDENKPNMKGREQAEFFKMPPEGVAVGTPAFNSAGTQEHRDKVKQSLGFLKARLKSLGVPEDQISQCDPKTLIGADVIFNVLTKNGYTNIAKVVLASAVANVMAPAGDWSASTTAGAAVSAAGSSGPDW